MYKYLLKLKICVLYESEILLLGVHTIEVGTYRFIDNKFPTANKKLRPSVQKPASY